MKLVRETFVALLLSAAAVPLLAAPVRAEVIVTVASPPPLLPLYEQPPLPDVGVIWVPGYWAYDDADGYFWVPGTWVRPPRVGLLWTPGYWAFDGGSYVFYPGYWAERIGYYGGVDYGFGYTGVGYQGGYWRGDRFFYNVAATRITDVQVVNVYNETIIREPGRPRVSFNGGPGGIRLRPTPEQLAFMHERHIPPTPRQIEHFRAARQDPGLSERENHGRPPFAATPRPGDFGRGGERPPGGPRTVIGTPEQRRPGGPRTVIGTPEQRPPGTPRTVIGTPERRPPEPRDERRPREPRPDEMRPAERRPRPDEMRPHDMRPPEPREHGPGPRSEGPRPGPREAGPGPHPGPHGPGPHPEPREHKDEHR